MLWLHFNGQAAVTVITPPRPEVLLETKVETIVVWYAVTTVVLLGTTSVCVGRISEIPLVFVDDCVIVAVVVIVDCGLMIEKVNSPGSE